MMYFRCYVNFHHFMLQLIKPQNLISQKINIFFCNMCDSQSRASFHVGVAQNKKNKTFSVGLFKIFFYKRICFLCVCPLDIQIC